MKLAIVGSVGVPASYGGFETLVEHLIGDDEHDYTVYCSGVHYKERLNTYKGARLVYIPISANGPASFLYDAFSIVHGIFAGHRHFLILGTSGTSMIPLVRLLCPSVRMVANIDGVEWRRQKWQGVAKRFLRFSESMAVRSAHVVVADNEAISDYVRISYDRQSETIAYGGDHALVELQDISVYADLDIERPYSLSLCRIEPENNVHMILQAFSESGEELVFIGNWQATDYGKKLLVKYSKFANLRLLDPIYDLEILCAYRTHCRVYVHGHSAGGTNPSLVEAMHFAKPIIAFNCGYNRASMEGKGAYFMDSAELKDRVSEISQSHDPEMREIALRKYSWVIVKQKYLALFS